MPPTITPTRVRHPGTRAIGGREEIARDLGTAYLARQEELRRTAPVHAEVVVDEAQAIAPRHLDEVLVTAAIACKAAEVQAEQWPVDPVRPGRERPREAARTDGQVRVDLAVDEVAASKQSWNQLCSTVTCRAHVRSHRQLTQCGARSPQCENWLRRT